MATKGERWVFVNPQTQVVDRESADLAFKAGHQTGVEVRLMNLPGEQYETLSGGHAVVPEGKVRIGFGRGSTGPEVQAWAKRHNALKKLMEEIKEAIRGS